MFKSLNTFINYFAFVIVSSSRINALSGTIFFQEKIRPN
jgi:hypothetical protein